MKTIITYGTFDLFHQGHYNILKRAKEMGDYLIVGVTSESYDLERGKLNVRDSLLTRIQNVRKTEFADEIIIEEYQGQKIGATLLDKLVNLCIKDAPENSRISVDLIAAQGKAPFYLKQGFTALPSENCGPALRKVFYF